MAKKKPKSKTRIKVKDVIVGVKKALNKKMAKRAEELLEEKVMALEKAKGVVKKLEREIEDLQEMDLTDLVAYLEDEE